MLNFPRKIVALFSLLTLAGCSFHSSQWESARALWALRDSKTLSDKETHWWDLTHEGRTYRLFPVTWNDKIVLMDSSRWMVVLRKSDILMVRDSLKNQQVLLVYSVKSSEEGLVAMARDNDSGLSVKSYGENSEHEMEISIVEGPIGQSTADKKSVVSCYKPKFNEQSLHLVRTCNFGEKETALSVVRFDHSGNITNLELVTLSDSMWSIRRSQDLVGARDVKRYLEGHH